VRRGNQTARLRFVFAAPQSDAKLEHLAAVVRMNLLGQ